MLVNCLGDNQESPFEVGGTLAHRNLFLSPKHLEKKKEIIPLASIYKYRHSYHASIITIQLYSYDHVSIIGYTGDKYDVNI